MTKIKRQAKVQKGKGTKREKLVRKRQTEKKKGTYQCQTERKMDEKTDCKRAGLTVQHLY